MLFLLDDLLEHMSLEKGASYNKRLISIVTGDTKPSDESPIEKIVGDVWNEMKTVDAHLAQDLVEPIERDVAAQLLLALQRFSQGIRLSKDELESTAAIEVPFSRHISVVNDVTSWDKECRAEREIDAQGAVVSNIVQVLSDECNLSPESAKPVLWAMCHGWAEMVDGLIAERVQQGCSDSQNVSRRAEDADVRQ
ncbi:Aristolochene synthase [Colletotrichum fructicola Nara gc5]|uniref:Aristolochene synthase n=1 Tax=Colletotrichum fructicola (strain Nara gc5) TaxID=1213859 RepID=A0A7J6JAS9_COLFN|nr:Aristolochene synthase [Colletotrichum fructicola Nara gc5]